MLLVDYIITQRQPQPGTLTGRLGGEKRREDLLLNFRRNAIAIVAHLDFDQIAVDLRRQPELR